MSRTFQQYLFVIVPCAEVGDLYHVQLQARYLKVLANQTGFDKIISHKSRSCTSHQYKSTSQYPITKTIRMHIPLVATLRTNYLGYRTQ